MNYSTAILLINPACRPIHAIYEPDPVDPQKPRAKRELFKTFDVTIKPGDIVMVPSSTRHGVTTVKVTDVDVEWDIGIHTEVRWIIGRIDQSAFVELFEQEEAAVKIIKESEKTHQRNELKKKMFAHMDDNDIAALQIAAPGPSIDAGNVTAGVETKKT